MFVIVDVLAFTLHAGGGYIRSVRTLEMYEIGEKVIVSGLCAQIVIFSTFVFTSLTINWRIHKASSRAVLDNAIP